MIWPFNRSRKPVEIWHYECENGHKWVSPYWPTSTYIETLYGKNATRCKECGSTIVQGDLFRDGQPAGGAIHVRFPYKKKEVKHARSSPKKSKNNK